MAYKNIAKSVLQNIIALAVAKHSRKPRDCFGNYIINNKTAIISNLDDALTKRLQDMKQYSADSWWSCSWWSCCWCANQITEEFINNLAKQFYEKSAAHLTADSNAITKQGIQFSKGVLTFPQELFSESNILIVIDGLLDIKPEEMPLLIPNNVQMTEYKNLI